MASNKMEPIRYGVKLDMLVNGQEGPDTNKIEKHLHVMLNNYSDVTVISVKAEQIVSEEADDG